MFYDRQDERGINHWCFARFSPELNSNQKLGWDGEIFKISAKKSQTFQFQLSLPYPIQLFYGMLGQVSLGGSSHRGDGLIQLFKENNF